MPFDVHCRAADLRPRVPEGPQELFVLQLHIVRHVFMFLCFYIRFLLPHTWCRYKFFELLGYDQLLDCFSLLKGFVFVPLAHIPKQTNPNKPQQTPTNPKHDVVQVKTNYVSRTRYSSSFASNSIGNSFRASDLPSTIENGQCTFGCQQCNSGVIGVQRPFDLQTECRWW